MKAEQILLDNGYEGIKYLTNYSYDTALIGVIDNRAVYDFNKMVDWLIKNENFKDTVEAIEWIEYNTIRALAYMGPDAPLIMYPLEV